MVKIKDENNNKKRVLTYDILISKDIEYMIESGEYKEGEKLPAERRLAETYDVQRGTVRAALKLLQEKGLIECKERAGYFVAKKRVELKLDTYNSTKTAIEQIGQSSYVKLLTFEKIYVSKKMAKKTGLEEDSQVYRIMRLRYLDGIPVSLERSHIRCDIAPNLSEEDVHNKSIYASLQRKHKIYMARTEGTVTTVYANGLESELLHQKMLKPMMRYEALAYDIHNRLVEYFDDIILKEKVQFISDER